ncbi:cytochrome P450 [Mycolicibacterium sp. BK634]|uniref:cytochrome P450 n=1 Tax=Mycolicibacterium sp. BK634 TaxID=2587099 RepID=UPI00161DA629|nr:cytochrome P450 [Mycolicibacterium sp. BK634]MBB3753904.1 cytochrome P450 [Mycolicibacterium sp. BK634]
MTITIDAPRMPNVFDAGLPAVDYDSVTNPDEALAMLMSARRQAPIAIGPHGPEFLTYELVHDASRDRRFRVPQGMFLASQGITSGPLWDRVVATIINMDGDEHHRLRRLVCKAFTPRATSRLRTTVTDVINGLVDRCAADGRCDVVSDIARHYPIPIICALLGVPDGDWEQFAAWTDEFFKAFSWNAADSVPSILAAWDELDSYVDGMVAERRRDLTDDLVSDLIRAEVEGDRLTLAELRMLVAGLLMAGTDTTRNQLAASVSVLCDHPDQWALLARQPELAANAVEETMRHSPIVFGTLRMTVEDVDVAGYAVPAGTLVILNSAAANRDSTVCEEPDRLDITRTAALPMQTFGGGVHYCLGANLARLELTEALTVMARRMPNIRRTGPAPWKPLSGLSGPATLPVEFDPGY